MNTIMGASVSPGIAIGTKAILISVTLLQKIVYAAILKPEDIRNRGNYKINNRIKNHLIFRKSYYFVPEILPGFLLWI